MKVAPITFQGAYFESLAWPISGTINKRPCGPDFAHQIADTLLRINLEGFVAKICDGTRSANYEEYELNLYNVVTNILEEVESRDRSLFSGGDEWEAEYSEWIGIHISGFYRRWCLLKDGTPGYDELLAEVKSRGEIYFDSLPGYDHWVRNLELHSKVRCIMGDTVVLDILELESLRLKIDYRLKQMKMVTEYKNLWGLTMKDCEDFDVETETDFCNNPWRQRLKLVRSYHLFGPYDQDLEYHKGEWYIATCIYNQGWDDSKAIERIIELIDHRVSTIYHIIDLMLI